MTKSLRKFLIIIVLELRILLKDRQALGLLFVMPLMFILFLTLALQDVYQAKVGKKIAIEYVTKEKCTDKKDVCTQLLEEMKRFQYGVHLTPELDPEHHVEIALLLPENIENTIQILKDGKTLKPGEQIQLIFDPTLDHSMREVVQGNLLLALQAVLIVRAEREMNAMASGPKPLKPIANVARFEGLVVEKAWGGIVLPNPIQQTVPAWALFGMFFIVIPLSNSVLRDRRLGIFKRLLSFPIARMELLVGKVIPYFVINILQFALMFAVGLFVLPRLTHLQLTLDFNLLHVFFVTLACALAATSYGVMVSCLVRTPEQASAFGALSVVILAIIGGVMIPRLVMPEFMQSLAQISPLYWGLEAYHDVIVRKAPLAIATGKIAGLLGFSLVCGLVSLARFHWTDDY